MAQLESERLRWKRKRVIFKRDYNREIEEVNRVSKLTCTLENVELLETVRTCMLKTKSELDEMYQGMLATIDEEKEDDQKLEMELLEERDHYLLNLDRAIGVCASFKKRLEGTSKRQSLNATSMSHSPSAGATRFPEISVPKFDGDLRKFLDYKALFENLVHHEEDMPTIRKMYYLKQSLVGEAARTLANINISEDGYKEAWGRVLSKYDNKRVIIHTHFNDLFSADRIRSDTNLRALLDQMDGALRGLRSCGEETDRWSSILSYMLYMRIDNKTKADFDNQVTSNAMYYDFKALMKFCENRASNVEARKIEEPNASAATGKPASAETRRSFLTAKIACYVCQGPHLLIDCTEFVSKTPVERLKIIQSNKLCVNCFSKMHNGPTCPSLRSCRICQQRHHYLLHLGEVTLRATIPGTGATTASNAAEQASATLTLADSKAKGVIVLPSAKVRLQCGKAVGEARVLIDSCSQPTLISDMLVRRLKLRTYQNKAWKPIRGVGFQSVGTPRCCKLTLCSRINNFRIEIEADVISANAIPYSLAHLTWSPTEREKAVKLPLADTVFYDRNPKIDCADIILGAQYVEQCLLNETMTLQAMTLRNTQFGWTLNGEFPSAAQTETRELKVANGCCFTTTAIENQVAQFLDAAEVRQVNENEKEEFCEEHFKNTYSRDEKGKFVVRLPFVLPAELLGANRRRAAAILNHCQQKSTTELWEGYTSFMKEYEEMGHMTRTGKIESTVDYVIPHHVVIKPESTTTRTRVVFNASAPSTTGYSLNDVLAVGPQLQPELFDALVRFRSYTIAFTADIAKMYRCVWVHPDDRKFQQILWRPMPVDPIQIYELNTITYGTAPASFLAVRCLFELAHEVEERKPTVAQAIREHFYMDDLMSGANNLQEAMELQSEIHKLLSSAGFVLRKYQSNNNELLQAIPRELWLHTEETTIGDKWNTVILGIVWNRGNDSLSVKCGRSSLADTPTMTKRQMLSEVSKSFDPLGLLSPVTLKAKLLVKQAWSENVKWDEAISQPLTQKVREYIIGLQKLHDFQIERPYRMAGATQIELIGFCDASQLAYAAVLYVRCVFADSPPVVRFSCAKTRIAPIKSTTIPKLELQAAVLLSEMAERVAKLLRIDKKNVHLFCDSQVVLAWLAGPLSKWTVFVRNRVLKIQSATSTHAWKFTPTEANPADLATRGLTAEELVKTGETWCYGPRFLQTADWSTWARTQIPTTTIEMERAASTTVSAVISAMQRSIMDRFSSYKAILAVFGRVISFTRKWRKARPSQVEYSPYFDNVSVRARIAAILLLQVEAFGTEINAIKEKRPIPAKSELATLDPFLDDNGMLRVRGRLANSSFSFNKRHPIILPRNCSFLSLYIRHLHESFCHAGKAFITSFIISEFWICGGLNAKVKAIINTCITCARYRAETYAQIMGQLPSARVTPSRPFANTGLDFCGPFNCKCVGHRSLKINKVYVCIFVCMVTRAIHVEVVSGLSTSQFVMSLHRFVARRGLPATLHSDCGTNFVGAKNYLDLTSEQIQKDGVTQSIQWIFNPPRAPHRGGIWESAVKAAKAHTTRVIGNQVLDYEEYVTLFTRIEAILNSRPLCYRVNPKIGEEVLTPAHFLIGTPLYSVPEPESMQLPLWRRYELLRILVNSFWKMWRADYLNMLQRKPKWQKVEENLRKGQVVLIKSDTSPGHWPLAVVEEVFPDSEGHVRTASVRTSNGSSWRRDIRSLVKIPVEVSEGTSYQGGNVDTCVPGDETANYSASP